MRADQRPSLYRSDGDGDGVVISGVERVSRLSGKWKSSGCCWSEGRSGFLLAVMGKCGGIATAKYDLARYRAGERCAQTRVSHDS